MEARCNVTGARRRELALAISGITGVEAEYKGVPTFNYEVGIFTITRDGTVIIPEDSDSDIVRKVLDGIKQAGFECETDEDPLDQNGSIGLTVSVPADMVNVENLARLLEAKGDLIKKALGVDSLPIENDGDTVTFPWFSELPDSGTADAYTHFISELCRMSREQKRVTATAKDVENEKYAFRCFLLRLGFIGSEYKTERKILLKNLSGSSAFKGGSGHEISG